MNTKLHSSLACARSAGAWLWAKPLMMVASALTAIAVVSGGVIVSQSHQGAGPTIPSSTTKSDSNASKHSSASSGLGLCPSATATGCDKSHLPVAGSRGSAGCKGRGPATLSASPIAVNDIAYIQPMGLMIGGHVTPIDHGYFYVKGAIANPPQPTPVYAPMDGDISVVSLTVRNGDPGAAAGSPQRAASDDYALTIEATCTFRVRFSNLVGLAGPLGDKIGQLAGNQSKMPNYSVKAGELIGHTGSATDRGIDVWVENDSSTLTGFINPAQYTATEAWKTHVVDLFQYTKEPLRDQLLALDERDAIPRWGKIDYDQDGKLVGSWFKVGTGGYGGDKNGSAGYWDGHLSVVYNSNDPEQIEISFGNYEGQPQQFAVIGNSPDPATVSQSTGLVKYELGPIEYYSADTGQPWDTQHYLAHLRTRAGTTVEGTVLMELVGQRSLRMEIFPGHVAAQINGFDSSALMYER